MGLAEELFEDARFLADKGLTDQRQTLMRRSISKQKNPTPVEQTLQDVITNFAQLQKDRERADYDSGWRLVKTDVEDAIRLSEEVFAKWREIKDEEIARNHLLSMFGAR